MLAGCIPMPKSLKKRWAAAQSTRAPALAMLPGESVSYEYSPFFAERERKSTVAQRSLLDNDDQRSLFGLSTSLAMGPMSIANMPELSRKSSKASGSDAGSCSTASVHIRHPSTCRSSSTSSSVDSSCSSFVMLPAASGSGSRDINPVQTFLKSYTLHVRLLMYARDLLTSMQSSRAVRTSFHDDPVLLPAEYFSLSDRHEILSTRVGVDRCYQDVVEEVLLDKRGHFSCTDILPLVQRTFNLRSEDILSVDLAKLQETFHKEYRCAARKAKAAEAMQQFGEHSV